MAQALTAEVPVRLTLNATAGLVTVLTVPESGNFYLSFRFITADGFITTTIADGVDKGAAFMTYDADTTFSRYLGNRGRSGLLGVSGTNNSQVVELELLPAGP